MRQQIYGPWVWLSSTFKMIWSRNHRILRRILADGQCLGKGFNVGQQTIQPHAIMLSDTLFWLTDQKESSGTVNNELDVKIQHSKEGQNWIFFGTSILFPCSSLVSDEFESLVVHEYKMKSLIFPTSFLALSLGQHGCNYH